MRTIMGDDRSTWRICRSQYPYGSTYGVEVDLPVQKGDLETASKMIQAAGYHDQKAVIINPTDFATIGPLGDITYDMFKKIGINAELQSTDWGSVVQRRATREPVEKGGWSVFHTWFTGGFTLNPVVSAPFRGLGAAGWFGWYENPKIEQLTQEWLDAKDEDARKKIAAAIQLENYAQVPTVTLGQFQIPTAYRKSLAGKLEFTGPLFWNVNWGQALAGLIAPWHSARVEGVEDEGGQKDHANLRLHCCRRRFGRCGRREPAVGRPAQQGALARGR